MASYLVTGGAGFIGSHLAEELVRRGYTVRVADSLITGKRRNLAHISGIEFLEGDLADFPFAARAMATLLFDIRPSDPLTYIGIAMVLGLAALAACYIPARRATAVDPMVALRYE